MNRIVAFIVVVVVCFGVIAWTSPDVIKNTRLGLDLKGGFEIQYIATPIEEGKQLTQNVLREAARSIEKRANKSGVEEPEVTPEGKDRIRVRIAGVTDPDEVRKTLKKPAELTFRSADGKVELNGSDFVESGAKVEYDSNNMPHIAIKLKSKEKFYEITNRLSQKDYPANVLAIYMDDEVISSPKVDTPINSDSAIITGSFTFDEAKNLAETINLGALPVKLTEKYTQSVGASLGKLSLQQTVNASLIASAFILLFMIFIYRIPGIVASVTLITYTWLLLLVMYLMNATLTLPGIAAFVLGVGMAVDANIITYERIKEEIRAGKSILSAFKAGSRNSFRTIIDANVTTIIAGVVLYFIGTGAIQGFALTLNLSILLSILTNVYFSRFLLSLLIRGNLLKKVSYFGVKESEVGEL